MDKDQFEQEYCVESEITLEEYREHLITMPCKCGVEFCQGFAAVNNDEISIKVHNDLYK